MEISRLFAGLVTLGVAVYLHEYIFDSFWLGYNMDKEDDGRDMNNRKNGDDIEYTLTQGGDYLLQMNVGKWCGMERSIRVIGVMWMGSKCISHVKISIMLL